MKKTIFYLLFLIMLSSIVLGAGLGVAPATLKFEDALKGVITEKTLTIQNPGEEPITATIEIDGEDWITSSADEVDIEAGGSEQITISIEPPKDAEDGYDAVIKVAGKGSSEVEGSGMGLLPGVNSNIMITLTDKEIIKGKVSKILTKDEKYGDLVKFTIGFENQGNVPIGPSVEIEIIQGAKGTINIIKEDLEAISPGTEKDYVVTLKSTDMDKNVYYRADITVMLNDEILEKKEGVGFRILESSPMPSSQVTTQKQDNNILPGLIVTIIIITMGLVIYFITRKK
ncbi:MAG: hypothetical protein ABIJ08_03240 [Nanoarchaeota archaeon]